MPSIAYRDNLTAAITCPSL